MINKDNLEVLFKSLLKRWFHKLEQDSLQAKDKVKREIRDVYNKLYGEKKNGN